MPRLHSAAVASTALLAFGIITTGCAGRSGPVEVPTQHDVTQPLAAPTPADAEQWADTVIPDNAVGGTDYLAREADVLEPGAEPVIVLPDAAGAGASTVTIACTTRPASELGYTVTSAGREIAEGAAACATVGDEPLRHTITAVPAGATVTVTAEAPGLFVYAVSPETDPAA